MSNIKIVVNEKFLSWVEDQFTWPREDVSAFVEEFISALFLMGCVGITEDTEDKDAPS